MKHTSTLSTLALLLLISAAIHSAAQPTFTRITATFNPVVSDTGMSGGGAWIDIDNDDDLDLFVSRGNLTSQQNRLYINDGTGTFTSTAAGDIITDGGSSIGSTWGDYDNDGFLDCFVTNRAFFGNFLYKGNGTANPMRQTIASSVTDTGDSNMSSWVDIDNDGDLDLYTVNFQGPDYLYLNTGATAFNFSANQGNTIQLDGTSFSIAGIWGDYNNDGRPDLFAGRSGIQHDRLHTNNGNLSFSSQTLTDGRASMGGSWGDFDNDGDLDLFVANYLNQKSILYHNSGAPAYTLTPDTTSPACTAGLHVGSAFGDIDNDGDLDLLVGHDGGNNRVYINSGYPSYSFSALASGAIVSDGGNTFSCAVGDYDSDGALDVFFANRLVGNFLYRNDGNANHWITVKCVGVQSNKAAIGTKVRVKATINGQPVWQMQEVPALTGYNSQNLWLHFGFGSATLIDTMIIRWPSGTSDTCVSLMVDSFYTRVEGVSCVLSNPSAVPAVIAKEVGLSITIAPVPVQDVFRVEIENREKLRLDEVVYTNTQGAVVARRKLNGVSAKISFSESPMQLGLKSGVYFAAVKAGSVSKAMRFVVQ